MIAHTEKLMNDKSSLERKENGLEIKWRRCTEALERNWILALEGKSWARVSKRDFKCLRLEVFSPGAWLRLNVAIILKSALRLTLSFEKVFSIFPSW